MSKTRSQRKSSSRGKTVRKSGFFSQARQALNVFSTQSDMSQSFDTKTASAKTHIAGTSKIALIPHSGLGITALYKSIKNYLHVPGVVTALLCLDDGTMFSIGFLAIARESYAKTLSKWSKTDVIQYVQARTVKGIIFTGNNYIIKNVTKNQFIKGEKLTGMYTSADDTLQAY